MLKTYNLCNIEANFRIFLENESYSPITIRNYLSDFRHFKGWCNQYHSINIEAPEADLGLITPQVINSYKIGLQNEGNPLKTINRRLSCLRTFFHFAHTQGWITHTPLKHVSNLSLNKALNDNEQNILIEFKYFLEKNKTLNSREFKAVIDTVEEFLLI
jgi:site-specific recombinase XerD